MKFQRGDEVEVVGKISVPSQIGLRSTVVGYVNNFVRLQDSPYNFYECDLKSLPLSRTKVLELYARATDNFYLWQARADFIQESGREVFDEEEFKIYAIKKLLNNQNMPINDKASRIKAIFA